MSTPISAQNPKSIQKMFNQIAPNYDKANTILSLGIHHVWKKKLVKRINPLNGQKIIDCATGTGDVAFLIEKYSGKKALVTGVDFSENMLAVAKQRALENKSSAEFLPADIESLPFDDESFNSASISFGIRNVRDLSKGLGEIWRILKPGGKLFILEFGQPQNEAFAKVYGFYSNVILPQLGGLVSGKKEAYKYLNQTSLTFPSSSAFCELVKKTTLFKSCKSESLSFGIAYIYTLEK